MRAKIYGVLFVLATFTTLAMATGLDWVDGGLK